MKKTCIIEAVAAKTGMKKKDAEAAVNAVLEAMTEGLSKGDKIQIAGFGSFDVKERAARKGRNPFNGETIDIPASKYVSFSAAKALKDSVQ